jgi:sterol desaturase/sphingolipid hydroxylase (fatty acid hydroxylase superfamily)
MFGYIKETAISFWNETPIQQWIGFILVGLIVEFFLRAEKNQPLRAVFFNIRYSLFYLVVIFVSVSTVGSVIVWVKQKTGAPWINLNLFSNSIPGQIGATILYLLLIDFFYYWLHRTQHRFNWLWQQHAVHHSDESFNITTTARHHWLEFFFQILVIGFPLAILFDLTPITVWILSTLVAGWAWMVHMNARVHLGQLGRVFVGPQNHRIHHSKLPQHHDKNFAVNFSFWDLLFGTYYHPTKDEYPPTGLDDGTTMSSVTGAALYPFKRWAAKIAPLLHLRNGHARSAELAGAPAFPPGPLAGVKVVAREGLEPPTPGL